MTKIKICGITNKVDAINASNLKIEMMGFVFYEKSKRYVEPLRVEDIVNELPPAIWKVGVFVDETKDRVLKIAEDAMLDTLQFHGGERPEYCGSFRDRFRVIKAFRLKDKSDLKKINDYDVDYYLFDTYKTDSIGGTGETFDWKIIKDYEFLKPVILSGGLTPKNVSRAIKEVSPYGVDVSTGVEKAPGRKDATLMAKFVDEVRRVN
ncbi:MAG: phosphoribosylanthranilate isomerase [Candidatus Omnitrophica bacterium]|nr:phosphoribosylanthranilate isomerase [Candidatus Omnitrophota bacterium]